MAQLNAYFTLGRSPRRGEKPVGYTIHRIAGYTYIRYTFKDDPVGPQRFLDIWCDISMQTHTLASSPLLSAFNQVDASKSHAATVGPVLPPGVSANVLGPALDEPENADEVVAPPSVALSRTR